MEIILNFFIVATYLAPTYTSEIKTNSISGMQGLKITCNAESQLDFISQFDGKPGFDFLTLSRNTRDPVHVLVSADKATSFKQTLDDSRIRYEVVVEDMGKKITDSKLSRYKRKVDHDILSSYPRYDEIKKYLENLASTQAGIATYLEIGKSFEGRDIAGIKISSGGRDKPGLLIDAGIHAREWIAPTTALYAIDQLARNTSNSHVFENLDFYVIPSINPDGYEFTFQNDEARLWRKTRSKTSRLNCTGVDANRNFNFHWLSGILSKPCSESYAGPKPFSEKESIALKNFILTQKNIKGYLTLHSYGNYILYPWGYTRRLPRNVEQLRHIAKEAEVALAKIRGTHYTIGSISKILYYAPGNTIDWVTGVANISLSYTIELPNDKFEFSPPPEEIKPIGQEIFEAIKVIAKYVEIESH